MMRAAAVLIVAAVLVGCNEKSPPPPPLPVPTPVPTPTPSGISMNPALWSIKYSPNMPTNPSPATTGWQFDFPAINGVHYITTSQWVAPKQAIEMVVSVTALPGTVFRYDTEAQNTCLSPAKVRLFFQRIGDTGSGQGEFEFYRWWSSKAEYVLAPGSATLVGDLTDLSSWTSVFGKAADKFPGEFAAALNNIGEIGMTFGGGCFYGHGVFVDPGSAIFNAVSFTAR